jgi:phosphoglycolate phosphatase-like HAD superfamily hydrolase
MPAAYADDAHAREDIMKCSLKRAHLHYKENQFDAAIYVGDGVWDVRASKNLKFKFIGIGSDLHAGRLKAEGATYIFSDYSDIDSFCAAIDELCADVKLKTHCLSS